ncbi:FAD-dependent oxidoreductase [Thalassoroseus pseudoceratinae]|uniref:FAD-dependent oxidoreductase n=1 Tax=Thalassoroseus pseudoceratinae TaxID=2713176 RepID=UPI001424032C|nr:FAD-dependent oxidoreductase [Thalassoroseus pseudoceratinae]
MSDSTPSSPNTPVTPKPNGDVPETVPNSGRKRIVILGGGFGGVYTAMELERQFRGRDDVEISLVNKENYFVFQPMLAEVVSGSIGITDTVSPIHRLLPKTKLYIREVESIDLANRTVTLSPGFWPRPLQLEYDHLVLALGTVTDFRGIPGIYEHALPFKNLADAVSLRNHVIRVLEEAVVETDPQHRRELLTFVIAGGGYSGVEVAAELNDFLRAIAKEYQGVEPEDIRVILVHSGKRILEREIPERLGSYAQNVMKDRGMELVLGSRLRTATPDAAIIKNKESGEETRVPTKTLISTVPSMPNPIIDSLDLPKERGKIAIDQMFQIEGFPDVSAIGDCMAMPSPTGEGFCPPTAQHATRQAKVLAHNIKAQMFGGEKKRYTFKGLGTMGSLGYHRAVALLLNRIPLGGRGTGLLAWMMWRTVYWMKLPGFTRKLKVGAAWFLDLIIKPETVQLRLESGNAISKVHFEPGETVFRQGDLGDSLYIILEGEAEVLVEKPGTNGEPTQEVVAKLTPGEYFGEMALLNNRTRSATVRCHKPLSLLALRQGDFRALVSNLPEMKESFQRVMDDRSRENSDPDAEADSPNASSDV